MNQMYVNADGEIQLSDEILSYLNLQKGEDVIFFEQDGNILIVNAAQPCYQIVLRRAAASAACAMRA